MYPLVHGDIKVFETGDESLSMDLFDTYGIMFIKVFNLLHKCMVLTSPFMVLLILW